MQGKAADAEPLQRAVLDAARRVYGPDHPNTLTMTNNLALTLDALGQYDEAERLYTDAIERRRRVLGEDHPSTLTVRNNHALLLQNTGRFDQAEPAFRDVVGRGRRVNGENHPNTLLWTNNLAWVLVQRGDVAGGEQIYRDLVPRARQAVGPRHPMTVSFLMRYGFTLAQQQERLADAEAALAEAYAGAQALGIADAQGGFASNYGTVLARREKYREALPVLLRADAALRRAPRRDPAAERRVADALVSVYEKLGPPERADEWRRTRDALATRPAPSTHASIQPSTAPATVPATQP
jgi:tetratricopeptide (TPR) repeat protein